MATEFMTFQLTLRGFRVDKPKTDTLISWVNAQTVSALNSYLKKYSAIELEEPPMVIKRRDTDDGIDAVLAETGEPFFPVGWEMSESFVHTRRSSKTHLMRGGSKLTLCGVRIPKKQLAARAIRGLAGVCRRCEQKVLATSFGIAHQST